MGRIAIFERKVNDTTRECADALMHIARDLRGAGDVPLVMLDEDGVAPASITLSQELELIAFRLNGGSFDGIG